MADGFRVFMPYKFIQGVIGRKLRVYNMNFMNRMICPSPGQMHADTAKERR